MLSKKDMAELKSDMFYYGISNKNVAEHCEVTESAVSHFFSRDNESKPVLTGVRQLIREAKKKA